MPYRQPKSLLTLAKILYTVRMIFTNQFVGPQGRAAFNVHFAHHTEGAWNPSRSHTLFSYKLKKNSTLSFKIICDGWRLRYIKFFFLTWYEMKLVFSYVLQWSPTIHHLYIILSSSKLHNTISNLIGFHPTLLSQYIRNGLAFCGNWYIHSYNHYNCALIA